MSATTKDAKVKVTVNLPAQQVEFLQAIAQRDGVTVTDMLKRAINSEKFFVEAESAHRRILIEDGTKIREVIRR